MMVRCIIAICVLLAAGGLVTLGHSTNAHASENERYKAIPLGGGGYVFIIDTREGHMWTWNNARQATASGENPRVVYQGNVRQNMKASATPRKLPPVQPDTHGKY